jgi:hypothetical protein
LLDSKPLPSAKHALKAVMKMALYPPSMIGASFASSGRSSRTS